MPDLSILTTLPVDDNVRSVKKDMAVPVPGTGDHRNSGKKDLDMTSEESGSVKPRKGVGSPRVSGRKGVEDDVIMTSTQAEAAAPETTTITQKSPESSSTTTTAERAQETTTKTITTDQPVLTHAPSNEPGKNVNQVKEQDKTESGGGSKLLVHTDSGSSDHAGDLKSLPTKPVKTEATAAGADTAETGHSLGTMIFGVILAMILVSVVLFVGLKRLDAIRRRREYR